MINLCDSYFYLNLVNKGNHFLLEKKHIVILQIGLVFASGLGGLNVTDYGQPERK